MNKFNQLRLLLWKNLLIKRRLPLVLFLELCLPFVLFVILGFIRHNNQPLVTYTQNAPSKAFPSAGLMSMMQALCSGSPDFPSNGDGLPMLSENSSLYQMLERIDSVYRDFYALYPNNSLMMLDEMPSHYEESLDQLSNLVPFFEISENSSLKSLLENGNFSSYTFANFSSSFGEHHDNLSTIFYKLQSRQKLSSADQAYLWTFVLHQSSNATSLPITSYKNKLPVQLNLSNFDTTASFQDQHLSDILLLHNGFQDSIKNVSGNNDMASIQQLADFKLNLTDNAINLTNLDAAFLSNNSDVTFNMTILHAVRQAALNYFNISGDSGDAFNGQLAKFGRDLAAFTKFHKTLDVLSSLVVYLPLDVCHSENSSSNSNTTFKTHNSSSSAQKSNFEGFYKIYQTLKPVICPNSSKTDADFDRSENDTDADSDIRSFGAMQYGRDLAQYMPVWVRLLKSNPRVLFTPANSSASLVMKKANQTFEFIDQLTTLARHWQTNISVELHRYFSKRETETKLRLLRVTQHHLARIVKEKSRFSLVAHYQKALSPFLEIDIKNASEIEDQLDLIDRAACSWIELVSSANLSFFVPFSEEYQAIDYSLYNAHRDNITVLAIVAFEVNATDGSLPPHTSYKIRMNSTFLPSIRKIRPIYWSPIPRNWDYYYYFSGFSFLQDIVDRAIIDILVGHDVIEPGTFGTNVPMPCYLYDTFLFTISNILPLCMTISFVYTAAILAQNIVAEKEHRLKEFMKVMGLSNTVHGLAWFITAFVQLTLSMTVVTLLLRYTQILLHSDPFIIWLLFETYAIATITFSFLISSLFSKAKIASATAGMLYFLSYVPAMCIGIREDISGGNIPPCMKLLASLFSTSAFGISCKYISLRESEGEGVHWDNIATSPIEHDSFSLVHAFSFLAFDSVMYALLGWYIEQIHPGSFGIPKPWYFIFTKLYWTGQPTNDEYEPPNFLKTILRLFHKLVRSSPISLPIIEDDDHLLNMIHTEDDDPSVLLKGSKGFEHEPTGLVLGVEINNITKVYKKTGKVAVNRLSLKLFESQITGLLGHNGAGKTSTMSILTGILPPTSGTARIYGLDIIKNLDTIRSSLGYCPQHNVLFEQLTPEEHLLFYSGLKRNSPSSADIDQMLKDVDLMAKRSTPVNLLSGGMKRKLSIAIAFIGNSRLVILDEPTAGVDPYSRRAIWDLIVKYKAGRTILLTTHHMDEADVLSDRIAIMSNGRIKCCGSSMFLRNSFCDGYHLVCVKSATNKRNSSEGTVSYIKSLLHSAYLFSESKQELHFILPYKEEHGGNFSGFFRRLDQSLQDIGLASYGLYDSTLEEAFLQITRTAQCEEGKTFVQQRQHHRGHHRQSSDTSAASLKLVTCTSRRNNTTQATPTNPPVDPTGQDGDQNKGQTLHPIDHIASGNTNNRHSRQSSADSIGIIGGNVVEKSPMPDSNSVNKNTQQATNDVASLLSAADIYGALGSNDLGLDELNYQRPRFIQLRHFRALIVKRLLYVRRNWKVLFSQIFLPAIFISIAMSLALSAPMFGDLPPFDLSPAQYYNTTMPRGLFTPVTNYQLRDEMKAESVVTGADGWSDANALLVADSLRLISGLSAKCTLKSVGIKFTSNITKKLSSTSDARLANYFSNNCYGAFTPGVSLSNFLLTTHAVENSPGNTTTEATSQLYYPICNCADDNSGFICPENFNYPPSHRLITGDHLLDIGSQNLTEYLLYTSDEYRRHRYGAVAFGNVLNHVPKKFGEGVASGIRRLAVRHVTSYFFEHRGYHSLPAYLNVVNNAVLRSNIQKKPWLGNPAAYGITTYNHPINGTDQIEFQDLVVQGIDMVIAIFVIIAMSFVPASFVVFLVYERSLLVKHTQIMAGLHPVMYWLTNYVWDLLNYFVPALCCIVILVIFHVPAYVAGQNLPAVVLLFLLYGWSMTPMMYPTSFYFSEASKAYVILVVFNLFVGTTCLITSFLLDMFHTSPVLLTVDRFVKVIFLAFPPYCLGRGIMDVAINHYLNEFYSLSGQYEKISSPFTWETTLRNYTVMAIEGFLFFGITILLEAMSRGKFISWSMMFRSKKRRSWTPPSMRASENDDPDVVAERHRVLTGSTADDLLVLDGLTKQYSTGHGPFVAVDRLSLGLPPGECFGLLGLNGAGKSTTFSLLSGILTATAGEARLTSQQLSGTSTKLLRSVGYCPQTDPLLDELTAREHLHLYARIRAIPLHLEKSIVAWLLERMGLELYADKPSRTFSGGTKRKLSAALALLGNPKIVLLDEPTTGMDPGSRRFLWNLILELRGENRLVVLTSHSMEECEILCSRLGVMVAGKLRCLGSTQQLKNKFGSGYQITIRMPSTRCKSLSSVSNGTQPRNNGAATDAVKKAFNNAGVPPTSWRFVAQRHQIIELALLNPKPNLSAIFDLLNKLRLSRLIDDFSVSQNTLDNVFLQLAQSSQPTRQSAQNTDSPSDSEFENGSNGAAAEPSTVVWADDEIFEEQDDEILIR